MKNKDRQFDVSFASLDASVSDMTKWTIQGLINWHKRTTSLRNQEAVFEELLKRGKSRMEVNRMLQ